MGNLKDKFPGIYDDAHVEEFDVIRANGDCICSTCGKEYWRHPYDPNILSGIEDHKGIRQPYLHVLCDGLRVKL